jgi:hypothetical protein
LKRTTAIHRWQHRFKPLPCIGHRTSSLSATAVDALAALVLYVLAHRIDAPGASGWWLPFIRLVLDEPAAERNGW